MGKEIGIELSAANATKMKGDYPFCRFLLSQGVAGRV
jgi:hypothetical protein